jgi:hypothetical protein
MLHGQTKVFVVRIEAILRAVLNAKAVMLIVVFVMLAFPCGPAGND